MTNVWLGNDLEAGRTVSEPLGHLAVFGQTRRAGKTTTLRTERPVPEVSIGTWARRTYRIVVGSGPHEEELIVTGEELDMIRLMIGQLRWPPRLEHLKPE